MIPERFVTEYPRRCGELLALLEQQARGKQLVGSFALLVASAAFTIPFGRMTENDHLLGRPEREPSLAIKQLKKCQFLEAPFWGGIKLDFFRYARIVNDNAENAGQWRDVNDEHPIRSTETKDANAILRVVRNALAHGNIVYLDRQGRETPGNQLRYLAFLSRHDDNTSYRVAIFREEGFLTFVKAWIQWVQKFPPEHEHVFEEVA